MGANRYFESVNEEFIRYMTKKRYDQTRITPLISSFVDAETVNRTRLDRFRNESREIRKWGQFSEMEDEREKMRARKGDYDTDCIEFAYDDNFCQMYFDYYGHGFRDPWYPNGSPRINEPSHGWYCPKCGVHHKEDLFDLKEHCEMCGGITPMGEMIRDGALRR